MDFFQVKYLNKMELQSYNVANFQYLMTPESLPKHADFERKGSPLS